MLPGFRFLFTAIVLSMSILIFGLGAAALLRAAHEEFASLPSRRATPAPMFARQNDDPLPTLALLRVDPPVAEKPAENALVAAVPEAASDIPASVEQTPDASPAGPEKLAALKPAEPTQVDAAKPAPSAQEPSAETPAPPAAPAAAEAPVNAEVKLAAAPDAPEPAAATPPPPTPDINSLQGNTSATRIATLGGPAVVVDETTAANTTDATPDRSVVKKRAAERARERRRIAARRARLAREATLTLQQQQPNPFLPFPVTRATR
jgi:outer membrane biosynthesis protein TonB